MPRRLMFPVLLVVTGTWPMTGCGWRPPPVVVRTPQVKIEGQGKVDRNPPGESFDRSTKVTLTATPPPGWRFNRWKFPEQFGEINYLNVRVENPLTVMVDHQLEIIAEFEVDWRYIAPPSWIDGRLLKLAFQDDRILGVFEEENYSPLRQVFQTVDSTLYWSGPIGRGSLDRVHDLAAAGEHLLYSSAAGVGVVGQDTPELTWPLPSDTAQLDCANGICWALGGMHYETSRGLFRRIDGVWQPVGDNLPLRTAPLFWLVVDQLDPANVVYVGGNDNFRTLDGGITWFPLDWGVGSVIATAVLDGRSVVFTSSFYSEDRGETWKNLGPPFGLITHDPRSGLVFGSLRSPNTGIYAGRPGGPWYQLSGNVDVNFLRVHRGKLYAASGRFTHVLDLEHTYLP